MVRYTLVAPYDIEALETAVNTALRRPPPAAVVPPSRQSVPSVNLVLADEIGQRYRAIVLATVRQLLEHESYRSRFPEPSRALVDELGLLLGTIANGLRHNLTPADTFSEGEIRRILDEHVRLRIKQGLGPSSAVHEQQLLHSQIDSVTARSTRCSPT